MIVQCPSCAARFRLDREKLAGKRLSLRCARCRAPFVAELPVNAATRDIERVQVMIGHSDRDLCGTIRSVVEEAGFGGVVGHNGTEVLAAMDALRPPVAVVDVALEGLYAFEVVDTLRRRPGLEQVKIILLSSVYNKAAYKRSPESLYGADDYIEKHHIPDDLVPKINRLLSGAVPAEEPVGQSSVEPAGPQLAVQQVSPSLTSIDSINQRIQAAEQQEVTAGHLPEEERARRLARIIVADISLYYQDRIDEGILCGNWSQLLALEIKEARRLFAERFPTAEVQRSKILESAFLDLLEKRRRELGA